MTVNAAGFYVTAVLTVAAALAAVAAPTMRLTLLAGAAFVVTVAITLMVSGAYVLGVVVLVAPLAAGLLVRWQARAHGARLVADAPSAFSRGWPVGAATALVAAALLILVMASQSSDLAACASGCGGGSLVTLVHWREPAGALIAAGLALFAAIAVVVIASESEAERLFEASLEERRRKQERIERRRADRDAQRGRSGAGTP